MLMVTINKDSIAFYSLGEFRNLWASSKVILISICLGIGLIATGNIPQQDGSITGIAA